MELTVLYRPVGRREYELIEAAGFRRFPPRLPEQPYFYLVANEEYATQIARDWNTKDEASGWTGYVLARLKGRSSRSPVSDDRIAVSFRLWHAPRRYRNGVVEMPDSRIPLRRYRAHAWHVVPISRLSGDDGKLSRRTAGRRRGLSLA